MRELLLEVKDLSIFYTIKSGEGFFKNKKIKMKAVNKINFKLYKGEILGIVGESGCGKSTLAKALLGLNKDLNGSIIWLGKNIEKQNKKEWKSTRKDIQMIFQDSLASLNPRMTIGDIIAEPLKIHFPKMSVKQIKEKVQQIMHKVGLLPNLINRYPHEFSGGQCQRIGIARALILEPKLIVCDEPVSALDVSIQAQVVNLLKNLQEQTQLSLIFIAHDLSIIKHISDRVMVMYLGNLVEIANYEQIYNEAKHPYTKALLLAVPIPDPKIEKNKIIQFLEGDLPSPINPPSGCVFRTRCPLASEICAENVPVLEGEKDHFYACFKI
ncbi:murein tripeptide/oligopeptide ABC transporter ATP binding protein OppF [Campylobacter sp. VicNov18]|uniref:murein tripeptide/oligopeptide ABC transporter ATP binding protein OppF n=1 Tax=Campylobacter bilis TaxID=2691918 RepID=UPI00130E77B9|nr:murein tripeptide/oligopeptide ABC transporter ATP binding protein OppF [Campylobacter bilis]MPV64274.1 murein tripeptide/oligopeptide ABC transporter ATP binding protein OppF [Campylobacter hepaticus]MBM0637780.1 murein tripeptide/oligopeptide ABC transporter ATP binding protein OppF [Campylobacter bilis]MCC8278507.1 murein tripeptide/oligopeptide ABC transporter ATP binding protein OppF [Campylobacter bilis]MCC8300010.1 murein tripeptide/oligopeptide ABC transporter ATP binding protein Opp